MLNCGNWFFTQESKTQLYSRLYKLKKISFLVILLLSWDGYELKRQFVSLRNILDKKYVLLILLSVKTVVNDS